MECAQLAISCLSCLFAQPCSSEKVASYLESPKAKKERLKKVMEMLTATEVTINRELEQARVDDGKKPNAEVELWLRNVQEIKESVAEKIADEKGCLKGCFSNYCSRVKIGKGIEEMIKNVDELLKRGQFPNDSLAYIPPVRGRRLPITMEKNSTTTRVIEELWECLMNKDVGRIGIHGMGGIGKTTIMTHINNLLIDDETTPFDYIIFVTVSKDVSEQSNLAKLQNDIAKTVNLNFSNNDDETSRLAKLFQALERRKRFLLILDDVWKEFQIEAVGIPNPSRENGCKLVLTTRSRAVCRTMETQRIVEVGVFSEEDAWELFKNKVNYEVLVSSDIEAIARNVARECAGLPLAIVTVGRALRIVGQDLRNVKEDWGNALVELKNSTGDIEGMEDRVFACLRFSYDRLRNYKSQLCFLYCALYPEGHQIEIGELIEYWMGEGLLGDEGRRRDITRKGKNILKELKDACMLESVDEDVKMHDLIRDMAIRITRTSPRCIIEAGRGLRNPPRESEWTEDVEKVSLMRNDVKVLVGEPRCPKLSSLLLQSNSLTENISPPFFNHMHNLKVLDLSYTGIKYLPDSFCNLKNLRTLLLCSCWNLSVLPSFAEFTELRVLDLFDTKILQLPEGVEMLVGLRRLNLSRTNLLMFPAGLLSKFTLLEDLIMDQCPFAWELESPTEIIWGACVEELIRFRDLTILQIHFLNMDVFHSYVMSGHSDQLESFKFWVGEIIESHVERNTVVICGYNLPEGPIPVFLPGNTLKLYIIDCNNIRNLPNLSSVHPPGTLAELTSLEVNSCQNLERLFLRGQLQHLNNLEEIYVSNCTEMKEIISEGENEMGETSNKTINLSRLRRLELSDLSNLISIYSGEVVCDSLRTIDICNCENLKRLALFLGDGELQPSPPPALREIKGKKSWWDSLEWHHPDAKNLLQPFFKDVELETGGFPSASASTSLAT